MTETNNTKQAAWVALGSLCSFAFGIVSSMILSRYFDKMEYGTYKQVLYVYNSLLAVFTLGLPKAYSYFLPRSPLNEAKNLISKITNLFFILGGFLSILLFISSGFIAEFLNNPALKSSLRIFSIVPFLMMPTMGLEGILATYRETKLITLYTFITRFVMLLFVTLPVVIFNLSCNDALVGFVFGSLISFILALFFKYHPVRKERNDRTRCSFSEIFQFTFPLFLASIWGILTNSTDQFFISRYFGTEVFADFSNGATELPFVGMIIGACSTVLTPLFTRQVYENADFKSIIYPTWKNAFNKSAMLIYPVVIFCLFDADLIMQVMYGEMYESSGDFFRIKLFTYFVKIISFYSILVALGATKFYSKVFMYGFFVLLFIEYLSILIFNNPLVITAVHALYTIISCLIFLYYIAKKFGISLLLLFPLRTITTIILLSILSIFVVCICKWYLYSGIDLFIELFVDLFLFMIIYMLGSIICKLGYLDIIRLLFRK